MFGFADGPVLPQGFNTFQRAPAADVGMEDYIFQPNLSFIPMTFVGTGLVTIHNPPAVNSNGVLALNTARESGLPGIIVPSFRTQPLSPNNPTG